jgi:hypothetical protein
MTVHSDQYARRLCAKIGVIYLLATLVFTTGALTSGCSSDPPPPQQAQLSEKDKAILERMKNNPPPPRTSGRSGGVGGK